MRYALLVCDDENEALSSERREERFAAFTAFQDEMEARGVLVGRERLRPTSCSTTVQFRDGGLVIADGPFAETKEQIAGFYVVDCKDLDEAIEVASKIPAARYGMIEVRPVWEM
jgi:hypothetical protein